MSTAGHDLLVGLLGGMVGPEAKLTSSRDVTLMALRANPTRSLSVAKIQEWLEVYFEAIGREYKRNRTIYVTLKRLCEDGVARRRESGGYIAVTDITNSLSDDFFMDIDVVEELNSLINPSESLDEVIHSLSAVIIGDQGEGAPIIKSLALLQATSNQNEFARLVEDTIKGIKEYTERECFKGFSECPEEDLLKWRMKHEMEVGGKWNFVVRDVFSKDNSNKTWIVSENRHSMFPFPESRKEFYQNIFCGIKLLRTCTLEAISVDKNGIREHRDYTYLLPNGVEMYCRNVCTIFETFRSSKGCLCRLHAGRTRNLTRLEYIDCLAINHKSEILSGNQNKVLFSEYASRGHAMRHSAHLLGFRQANSEEIAHFINISCAGTELRTSGTTFNVRDIMCCVAEKHMVVYHERTDEEMSLWDDNKAATALAYLKGSADLKSQAYSIFSLFEEDTIHVCSGEVNAYSSENKLLISYDNVTIFNQT
jgi:hypothetical protein